MRMTSWILVTQPQCAHSLRMIAVSIGYNGVRIWNFLITVMHLLKHIVIVQKLTLVVSFWAALLSSCWLPLLIDHSCNVTYVVMCTLGHVMMKPNALTCERARGQTIFSVKASDTACDWSLLCKLLMAYSQLLLLQRILWATETALFWENLCMYPQEHIEHVTTIDSEIQTWLRDTNFSNIQIWKGSACIPAFVGSPDTVHE